MRAQNATYRALISSCFPKIGALLLLSTRLLPHTLLEATTLVSVSSQTAAPGSSVILQVVFQSNGDAVSGVQFDIQYDNSAISLIANVPNAANSAGKLLYEVDLAPNIRRFLIVGLNSSPIANGTLITLFVNLSPNVYSGVFPLAVSNVIGTDPNGITASLAGLDGAISVAGTIAQSVPLQTSGVLNGASLASGPVAPGEVFTLLGSNIGATSTQARFDGIPASLFYVGSNQINGITPNEVAGNTTTHIEITAAGQVISDLVMPTAPQSPAIFTLDGSGVGQGAILNQDFTVNSPENPAVRGAVVAVYATGAGMMNPSGVDGQTTATVDSQPLLPVSVEIAGGNADVLYAGSAPGLISGVLQINCRVPMNVTPSYSVTIVLIVGGVRSPGGVTLAVQ